MGTKSEKTDYATLYGIACSFGVIGITIASKGLLLNFIDIKGFVIVLGGTIGATLMSYSVEDFQKSIEVMKGSLFRRQHSPRARIEVLLKMAHRVRLKGPLALKKNVLRVRDPFFKKCIELVVDDLEAEAIRRSLEIENSFLKERHRKGVGIFQTMGSISPAMGLIGTIIGLIEMLGQLSNKDEIGPAMALALLSTLYGACMAHLIFFPLSEKLRSRGKEEKLIVDITAEATVCMKEKMNPRLLEQRLLGFLAPEERYSVFERS